MQNPETKIQNKIMMAMSKKGWLCWRNQVGLFKTMDGRTVNIGIKGSSDLMAVKPTVITPEMVGQTLAVFVAVEVKTATGRQSEPQKKWQKAVEKLGVKYIIARCEDDID